MWTTAARYAATQNFYGVRPTSCSLVAMTIEHDQKQNGPLYNGPLAGVSSWSCGQGSYTQPASPFDVLTTDEHWDTPDRYGYCSPCASPLACYRSVTRTAARILALTVPCATPRHSGVCGLRGQDGTGRSGINNPIWPKQSSGARPFFARLPAAILPFRRFSPRDANVPRLPPPNMPLPDSANARSHGSNAFTPTCRAVLGQRSP